MTNALELEGRALAKRRYAVGLLNRVADTHSEVEITGDQIALTVALVDLVEGDVAAWLDLRADNLAAKTPRAAQVLRTVALLVAEGAPRRAQLDPEGAKHLLARERAA